MVLKIYNTLTGTKEEFYPTTPGKVKMYVCGPTVYNNMHLGNARCYLVFDLIRKYLTYKGYHVINVSNITDIDDKIIARAEEEGTTPEKVAEKYTQSIMKEWEDLEIEPADFHPKATEHIQEMIKIIYALIEEGNAYEIDGDVFFSVELFKSYGKLSHRKLDEMIAGSRVEVDKRKRHPMDFALWKKAKENEPSWDSPWGKGRPGWHIECSAMSLKYLGMGFDIHGGGQDLIFPHHENEIAQSEAYYGEEPFVRFWVHNGFVQFKKEKMAKSTGNVIYIRDILNKYSPEVIKLFFYSTHYRSPLEADEEKISKTKNSYQRLINLILNLRELTSGIFDIFIREDALAEDENKLNLFIQETKKKFIQAMDDDFNSPAALASLFELFKQINIFISNNETKLTLDGKKILRKGELLLIELGNILGLFVEPIKKEEVETKLIEGLIRIIIDLRNKAREKKDYQTADKIRDELTNIGITLEDRPQGTTWKIIK